MQPEEVVTLLIQGRAQAETGRLLQQWALRQAVALWRAGRLTDEQAEAIRTAAPMSKAQWDQAIQDAQ